MPHPTFLSSDTEVPPQAVDHPLICPFRADSSVASIAEKLRSPLRMMMMMLATTRGETPSSRGKIVINGHRIACETVIKKRLMRGLAAWIRLF
jgi:hypothetical protein